MGVALERLAEQCGTCLRVYEGDSADGILVLWIDICLGCLIATTRFDEETSRLLSIDAHWEALLRAGKLHTPSPVPRPPFEPSHTHEAHTEAFDKLWSRASLRTDSAV